MSGRAAGVKAWLSLAVVAAAWLVVEGFAAAAWLDVLLASALAGGLARAIHRLGGAPRAATMWGVSLGLSTLALAALAPAAELVPYLGIVVVNAGLGVVFLRGLAPERTPVILQLIRLMDHGPGASAAFARFVRGQCRAWAGLTLGTAVVAAIAMLVGPARPVLDPALAVLVVGQAAWFVLSHRYANRRFARPETWRMTLRVMVRPRTWAALEI